MSSLRNRAKTPGPWLSRSSALKEIQGEGKQSKINQLFSSHPDLDKRIQRMEKRATDEGITPPEVKAEEKK